MLPPENPHTAGIRQLPSAVTLPSLAQQATDRRLPLSPSFHPVFGIRSPARAAACPGPACACTAKHAMRVRLCRDPDYQFIHAPQLRSLETRHSPPSLPCFQPRPKLHLSAWVIPSAFGARESGSKLSMITHVAFLLEKTNKIFCRLKKNFSYSQVPSFSLIYHSTF